MITNKRSCRVKRAAAVQPRSAEAWRALGASLHNAGRPSDAAGAFEKACTREPELAETHAFLGAAMQALGETERAVLAFQKAVEIAPDYEHAHFALNQLLWTSGDTRIFLKSYALAESNKLNSADIRCAHAHTLMLADRHAEAENILRQAAQIDPNHLRAKSLLGDLLSQLGSHAEATTLLEAAQRQAPSQSSLRIGYARSLLRAATLR